MPNGHGGAPFMGAPIIFAVMFAIFAAAPLKEALGWAWVAICLACAALAGWRLAYHLHMRAADEYSGAYISADAHLKAVRRYWVLAPLYAALAAAAGFGILWWRGLP
jgi:uncharacterized protein (DUF2062 family)